jgi:transcription-repair coupling factor (superfamily II helicase)
MDRLVCGDVGYGKTEVALRAAFKAVNAGYQVAILVPTTVLAVQHFATFRERFVDYPVEVRCLSRFNSVKENKQTIIDLSAGKVDIAIGTHRLLQSDISFSKLGLLIIDEEHRFGVAAKEKLKRFRAEIDILTLTATPIPRTLNMSLVGIRDLSLIETPPVNRQVVRTFVSRYDERMAREAILRELGRNGQVFYIHNRVQSIAERAKEVRELVPEARVEFAHGQMKERELEEVMLRFVAGEIDVLVSTTIIESGLDIPNANTILIRDAHAFGLAELYQLRGRVGRSARRAFAYLFVGDPKKLGEGAKKRLQVLQALDDLGIGFRLALQDMEIRGAGNLLGKDQSGQINAVGYELYSRILKDAVKDLRKRKRLEAMGHLTASDIEVDPEVNLGFPSHIPPFYIPDVAERLLLYQRMIGMGSREEVLELEEEMEDRFGYIPREVNTLLQLMNVRVLMKMIGATSAYFRDGVLRVSLHPEIELDTDVLLKSVRDSKGAVSLSGNHALLFRLSEEESETPMDILRALMRHGRGLKLSGLDRFRL